MQGHREPSGKSSFEGRLTLSPTSVAQAILNRTKMVPRAMSSCSMPFSSQKKMPFALEGLGIHEAAVPEDLGGNTEGARAVNVVLDGIKR
eukprot:12499543-Alexandrium_andersonii.AAC.1